MLPWDELTGRAPHGDDDVEGSPFTAAVAGQEREAVAMVQAALAAGRMRLACQPVLSARHRGRIAYWEGLIRLLDETGRVIPAADFMPEIEAHELGRVIDRTALALGLDALSRAPALRLAVNLSARSIGYGPWLATLDRALAGDPTLGERLILEITESSAMLMPDLVSVFMRDMRARGLSFALDDFGAGHTSFRHLRSFTFDILKIDGGFIRGIASDADNQVLTAALISIARHFDMLSVAESVERAADAEHLAAAGIDAMQGYRFGAPTLRPPWLDEARETERPRA